MDIGQSSVQSIEERAVGVIASGVLLEGIQLGDSSHRIGERGQVTEGCSIRCLCQTKSTATDRQSCLLNADVIGLQISTVVAEFVRVDTESRQEVSSNTVIEVSSDA